MEDVEITWEPGEHFDDPGIVDEYKASQLYQSSVLRVDAIFSTNKELEDEEEEEEQGAETARRASLRISRQTGASSLPF
jgi:hypothetical protein